MTKESPSPLLAELEKECGSIAQLPRARDRALAVEEILSRSIEGYFIEKYKGDEVVTENEIDRFFSLQEVHSIARQAKLDSIREPKKTVPTLKSALEALGNLLQGIPKSPLPQTKSIGNLAAIHAYDAERILRQALMSATIELVETRGDLWSEQVGLNIDGNTLVEDRISLVFERLNQGEAQQKIADDMYREFRAIVSELWEDRVDEYLQTAYIGVPAAPHLTEVVRSVCDHPLLNPVETPQQQEDEIESWEFGGSARIEVVEGPVMKDSTVYIDTDSYADRASKRVIDAFTTSVARRLLERYDFVWKPNGADMTLQEVIHYAIALRNMASWTVLVERTVEDIARASDLEDVPSVVEH